MAAPEFFLSIDVSGSQPPDMVRELVSRVLSSAGCDRDRSARIIEELQAALEQGQGTCQVTFLSRNNHLEISVSAAVGELWQITQSLP